jgi:ADP-heptose:LPS heptosyltransferase
MEQPGQAPGAALESLRRILWVRTDAIGDNLLAASMLPRLRAACPQAAITVVCQETSAPLYECCPHVAATIAYDRSRAYRDEPYRQEVAARILQAGADLALHSVYSREELGDFWVAASGAPRRVGHAGDLCNIGADRRRALDPLYTDLVPSGAPHRPELERHAAFLEALGIPPGALGPAIWLDPEDQDTADQILGALGLAPERTLALFAGAQYDERVYHGYGTALKEIVREQDFRLIALGGGQEAALNQAQLDAVGPGHINLCGRLTLRQAGALLKRCRLAVGAETGLAHLACAVGTPQVIVLGGGHFGRFMPYSQLTTAAILPLDCYLCDWHCRYAKAHCVKDLHPVVLEAAIRETLKQPAGQSRIFAQPVWAGPAGGPALQTWPS